MKLIELNHEWNRVILNSMYLCHVVCCAVTMMRNRWRAASTLWTERSKQGTVGIAWQTMEMRRASSMRMALLLVSMLDARKRGCPLRSRGPVRPQHEERSHHPSLGHHFYQTLSGERKYRKKRHNPYQAQFCVKCNVSLPTALPFSFYRAMFYQAVTKW